MRITVSIPEEVYRATVVLARRLGVSRSILHTRAVEEFVDQHGDDIAVHPLIRKLVEPILIEELSRLSDLNASPPHTAAEHADRPSPIH